MIKEMPGLILFTLLFVACNNSDNNNTGKVKTYSDTLMDEVMEGHNAGMSKMSKLSVAQKKIQQAIDSIARLPGNLQSRNTSYKMHLDSILRKLKYAEYAMNKWMDEFRMDSEANNEDGRIKYLESEKIKIGIVKDTMNTSLQAADSLLKKKL